jgi:hypothetical protein
MNAGTFKDRKKAIIPNWAAEEQIEDLNAYVVRRNPLDISSLCQHIDNSTE